MRGYKRQREDDWLLLINVTSNVKKCQLNFTNHFLSELLGVCELM